MHADKPQKPITYRLKNRKRMITVEKAEELIARELKVLPSEKLPFRQVVDRVLRETVSADRDLPPYNRVMMDGITLCSKAWMEGARKFEVEGTQFPGQPPLTLSNSNHCIKTMTGAVLPEGCNLVVPCEEFEQQGNQITVNAEFSAEKGRYLHKRGSDCSKGDELLKEGVQLGPKEIAMAVSCGKDSLSVTRKIKIRVIDTGDELIDAGKPVTDFQIRRSNAHALVAACTRMPFVEASSQHCPDEENVLNRAISESMESFDILLLCGGVSKGDRDLTPTILTQLGFEECFHWVSQWPGKPMWFGKHPTGALAFGLPGNPLSALTCFHRYVVNALYLIAGTESPVNPQVLLTDSITHNPPTTAFFPVSISRSKNGLLEAKPRRPRNSGDFTTIVNTDGFIQLPSGQTTFRAGFFAKLFPW